MAGGKVVPRWAWMAHCLASVPVLLESLEGQLMLMLLILRGL